VGLLGWKDDPKWRLHLRRVLEQDGEETVRAAALRGLGRIGDRETLGHLKTFAPRKGEVMRVPSALAAAIHELQRRFPE
jgi:hypothetical protein